MKIIKVIEFKLINMKIHENLRIEYDNQKNYETIGIQLKNNEKS